MAPFAEVPILAVSSISPMEVSKEPDLTDGWWTSDHLFALERQAIFSKSWMCIAHSSNFTKRGDYISFEIANFPILIILGRDNVIRAFHNVCRHRAYTITKKASGSSLVLGCRYHGWSYDTKGNLIKAPQFDGIEGFDKSENGLFKIHTCVDRFGFIHINLNASRIGGPPEYEGTSGPSPGHGISASNKWLTGWEINGGAFNWKTVGASDRTGIGTYTVPPKPSIMSYILSAFRRPPGLDTIKCQSFFVGPIALILTFSNSPIWALITVLPASAAECIPKCNVYTSDATTTQLTPLDTTTMQNYCNNFVHSTEQHYNSVKASRGPRESTQLALLKEHLRLERVAGHKIYPARKEDRSSLSFCKAEQLCYELDAKAKHARVDSAHGDLDW